jgi:hypothetical protein
LVAVLAFGLWAFADTTIIGLVLWGYSIIVQLFPGVVLSFLQKPPRAMSVGVGIVVALTTLVAFGRLGLNTLSGINVGLVALILNTATVLTCEYLTKSVRALVTVSGTR